LITENNTGIKYSKTNVISVNWHLCWNCNYSCKFCFGGSPSDIGPLSYDFTIGILEQLTNLKIQKITFTGGEPFLFPYLGELLKVTNKKNISTMIVSNGSLITYDFLLDNHNYIDWIGLSLDSAREKTELMLGRGSGNHIQKVREASNLINAYDIKLKINSVITSSNYQEDMSKLIKELEPERWKVFQVLKVEGENDDRVDPLLISKEQFMSFVNRHKYLNPICESNNLFRGSYVMLDPLGRFFQNSKGHIEYSRSILDIDPLEALAEVGWDKEKFLKRGGIYEW